MHEKTPTTGPKSKPTLKRGSKPYIFHIESKSRPGTFHVTDALRLSCTCEAGRLGRLCWHVRLAVGAYDWWKRQGEQGQAARTAPRAQAANETNTPGLAPAARPAPTAPRQERRAAIGTGDLPPLARWFE